MNIHTHYTTNVTATSASASSLDKHDKRLLHLEIKCMPNFQEYLKDLPWFYLSLKKNLF